MSSWQYYNPVSIQFGWGALSEISKIIRGGRCFLLTTPGFVRRGVTERVRKLVSSQLEIDASISEYPSFESLRTIYGRVESIKPEWIIALGGGSVMDSAKVVALRARGGFPSIESSLREGGDLLIKNDIPVVAIPTTAGTGSEVTSYSTIWDFKNGGKYSLSLQETWPDHALVDPELTLTLGRELTLHTGLDALSHSLESLWNRKANPISISHAVWAARIIIETLPILLDDLENREFRTRMSAASLRAGLAISSTQTALAHALSYSLTAKKGLPHGLACSFTLEKILNINYGISAQVDENLHELFGGGIEVIREKLHNFFSRIQVSTRISDYNVDSQFITRELGEIFSSPRFQNNINQDKDKISRELVDGV